MISFFRNITVRLWGAVLFGGVISIWLLPTFQNYLGLDWLVVPVLIILVSIFWGAGWFTNLWGLSKIQRLIQDAAACERDGMYLEAEAAFLRAVAVLDSFLISPMVKRKNAPMLASRLARFYLARADKSDVSEAFLVSNLSNHPDDEEVAEAWVHEMESQGGLKLEHQEMAYKIGSALSKNTNVQFVLARFYLLFERTDFPALHTYRQVLNGDDPVPSKMVDDLSQLLLREKRADEWSLKIYLLAFERCSDPSELLKGIAACLRWTRPNERNQALFQKARSILNGIEKADLIKMSSGFTPPRPPPITAKVGTKPVFNLGQNLRAVLMAAVSLPSALLGWCDRNVSSAVKQLRQSNKARRTATALLLGCVAVGAVILIVNTVGHLARTDKIAPEIVEPVAAVVTDPFTLQVAAYLQAEHAAKYVDTLKKQGLDAYWQEAISSKKKWYQVRVSHFADKASARAFGETLKTKGIIKDYFVANYRRPGDY